MINKEKVAVDSQWFQIFWEDEQFLSGNSVSELLQTLNPRGEKLLLRVSRAEGTFGSNVFDSEQLYSVEEFTSLTNGITQFDWANIFIGQREPIDGSRLTQNEEAFSCFEYVVCLADSAYIYVYSKRPEIARILEQHYAASQCNRCTFNELTFMY